MYEYVACIGFRSTNPQTTYDILPVENGGWIARRCSPLEDATICEFLQNDGTFGPKSEDFATPELAFAKLIEYADPPLLTPIPRSPISIEMSVSVGLDPDDIILVARVEGRGWIVSRLSPPDADGHRESSFLQNDMESFGSGETCLYYPNREGAYSAMTLCALSV